MKRFAAVGLALAAAAAQAAQRPDETRAEVIATEGVVVAIQHGDCKLATERLNAGLANKYPGFYLLAGTMYEEGLCLKPNWERAVQMYQRAVGAKHMGGVGRLVAGYADRSRDPAAALWWAHQPGGVPMPGACRMAAFVLESPDALVAELRAWPAQRLAACVYAVGVLAAVSGDAQYPRYAAEHALAGTIEVSFQPASGTLEWRTVELQAKQIPGLVSSGALLDRASRSVRDELESSLRQVGERALRRFERPAGIDPAWSLTATYVFNIRYD